MEIKEILPSSMPPAICNSQEDVQILTNFRKSFKSARERVIEYWKPAKKQADLAKKALLDKENEMLNAIDQFDIPYKQAIESFLTSERIRQEEEAKEKARIEKERLEREIAEKLESGNLEEAIETEQDYIPAPVIVERQKGTSEDLEIQIVDLKKFLQSFIESGYNVDILDIKVNQTKLKTFCKSMKIEKFPGLQIKKTVKQILRG